MADFVWKPVIAICSNYPADHATFTSGVETATAALLEGLRAYQDEFHFHVISVPGSLAADVRERRDGFWFHFLSVPRHPWVRPRLPFRVLKTQRELRQLKPDLVHCQDNMALALATILGGHENVFTVHGVKRHEAPKRTGWESWSARADALIERWVHRHFDAFICISTYSAEVVGETRPTFSIPNPARSLFFQTSPSSECAQDPYLLYVGVLAPLKRPADLLLSHVALCRERPDLETIFCGDVEDAGYATAMRRKVEEDQIQGVHFKGRLGQEDLAELLRGALALVLPSSQENAPMVIAEAMAAGVPVVATRVGGMSDLVQHGETGFLYKAAAVDELTSCLRRLLEDAPLQQRMRDRAREVAAATYSPARVAAATVAAYRHLLDGQSKTATGSTYVR